MSARSNNVIWSFVRWFYRFEIAEECGTFELTSSQFRSIDFMHLIWDSFFCFFFFYFFVCFCRWPFENAFIFGGFCEFHPLSWEREKNFSEIIAQNRRKSVQNLYKNDQFRLSSSKLLLFQSQNPHYFFNRNLKSRQKKSKKPKMNSLQLIISLDFYYIRHVRWGSTSFLRTHKIKRWWNVPVKYRLFN